MNKPSPTANSVDALTKQIARSSAWRVVGANATSKVAVMVVSSPLAFISTRLIIEHFGIDAYAQYGLLASMGALVPFADLGMSAAILNAVASSKSPATDSNVRRTLLSAFRVLISSTFVLASVGMVITLLGLWPALLGAGLMEGGPGATLLCVLVFAATLPLGVGQRILTGLGKNHVQVAAQALAAPFILVCVAVFIITGAAAGNYLAVLSYLAGTLVAGVSMLFAIHHVGPQVRLALRDVPKVRAVRGAKTMNVAWPMLAQMLALPFAMQTDRLLLSHLSNTAELAQYNLGAQLFGMITMTVGTAGLALWPIFARARTDADIRSPMALALAFTLGSLGMAGVLTLLLPWVVPIVSNGQITLDTWVVLGFVAFVGGQAAKYPLGMYMTDAKGLRFQVVPIFILVPVNLALSWMLIAPIGAGGPIMGSAIAVILCQVLPNFWYVRHDLAARRSE